MRVFLDANILFSAALPASRMASFLEVLFRNAECLTSDYALEEARRNLALKSPRSLPRFERLAAECERAARFTIKLPEVSLKEKDLPILEGAVAGHATHLLTGDERDFGAFFGKMVLGVRIVSSFVGGGDGQAGLGGSQVGVIPLNFF